MMTTTNTTETSQPENTVRALFRQHDYMRLWLFRFCAVVGTMMQSVAMGWQIYDIARRTHNVEQSSLYVGLIGLCAFVPLFLLALPAGEAADRHERRRILIWCMLGEVISVSILFAGAFFHATSIGLLLGVSFIFGTSRAYQGPSSTALAPMLVPRLLLPRAIAWNSLAWQTGAVVGPAIGGALVAISPWVAYAGSLALYIIAAIAMFRIKADTKPEAKPGSRIELVKEGLNYVWANKIVFGSISLDLVAVLLGGVTALLPVFSKDVLHVGAEGFGVLRAAPAIGAASFAVLLAAYPIKRHSGAIIFVAVGIFGASTLVFGLSRNFYLSMAALIVQGAADMLSVFVRQTLVQLVTPDPMRGRTAAVSSLFISASNEFGEFTGGVFARLLNPVNAAIFGGAASMAVTALWAKLFPALRKADKLE